MSISTECGQAIVDGGLYWWHRAILQEVVRIEGYGVFGVDLLADNMKYVNQSLVMDSLKAIASLEAAGMLLVDSANGETADGKPVVTITELGREWAGGR